MKERLTEYHAGVAVIKNKAKLSDAMAKLANYEDFQESIGKTYDEGLNEAWDAAKRLTNDPCDGGFSALEVEEIFGNSDIFKVFNENSVHDAIRKIKEWEERTEFKPGDIVRCGCAVGVVTKDDGSPCVDILWSNGDAWAEMKTELEKTGRTVDIAGFLAQIGAEQ